MRGALPAIGVIARRLVAQLPAAGRGSPVIGLLLLMAAATVVAYWSPPPSPANDTTPAAAGSPSPATPPLLLKVGAAGQEIGQAMPHSPDGAEYQSCLRKTGGYCDVVSEPSIALPPGALVKVIDQLEIWQRGAYSGGSRIMVTWYRVQAIKPDGTDMLGADGKTVTGWSHSTVFLPVSP